MSERGLGQLAWGVAAIVVALLAANGMLLAVDGRAAADLLGEQAPWLINSAVAASLGLLIAVRRPRHPIGWLLLVDAALNLVGTACLFGAARVLLDGTAPTAGGVRWLAWLSNMAVSAATDLYVFILFLFPDGRPPGPRWRPVLWFLVALCAAEMVALILGTPAQTVTSHLPRVPAPIHVAALAWLVSGHSLLATISPALLVGIVLVAVVARFRRSSGIARAQMKLFAYVIAVALPLTLVGFAVSALNPSVGTDLATAAFDLFAGVVLPLTIGVAIMRYGLYELDIVISRALVYSALGVFITGVYVGIAVGIGELVGSGGKPNLGLSILATAIVAAGFQPVRERVQRIANRLVYGKRATPYEVLSQFSSRVAESYTGNDVLFRMARVLREGTAAEAATVWIRSATELRPAATDPNSETVGEPVTMLDGVVKDLPGATRVVTVRHQEQVLGALSVVKRRGEALTPLEEKLLNDLARQAGLVLKNVGLTADLQARLEDLRNSRQRLVSAQDEARRRLERNLHDGAQQHLVALKVKLGLAEMLLTRDADKAKATVVQLKADADEALETLRDLARGIYPPLLADKGLVAALQAQARKAAVPVVVEALGVERYPQEVESTAYFCCLEALQNVQKYAQASRVTLRVGEIAGQLRFEVEDNGSGFDPALVRKGAGLTNMEDRLDALGGAVEVRSVAGRGTTVRGWVPLQPLPADHPELSTLAPV